MPDPVTGLVVGGTQLLGGAIQSSAAGKASKAQQQSAEAGIAEQRRQFDALQKILSPYVQAGTTALGGFQPFIQAGTEGLNRLNPFLDAGTQALGQLQPFIQAGTQALGGLQDFGAAGSRSIGGLEGFGASGLGATSNLQEFGAAGTAGVRGLDPYAAAGAPALQQQQALLGLRGPQAQQASISNIERSPAFQAQVRQGEEAILQAASATGGLRGGNVQAALAQFRPQMLQREIDLQYGRLGGMTSLGAGTSQNLANLGLTSSQNLASLGQSSFQNLAGLGQSSYQNLANMGLTTAQNLAQMGFTGSQNLANMGQAATQNLAQLGQASAAGTGAAGLQTGARIASLQSDIGSARAGADLARGQALSSVFNLPAQFLGAQYGAGQTPGFGGLFSGGGSGGQAIYANSPFNTLQDPGGMAQTNIGFSDRRLKTNIHRISSRPDGLGVYEFEYIWGGGKHIGLMAQEVLGIYPDAVGSVGGYYTVDYSRV